MPKIRYLLDVNVLYALLSEDHIHHRAVSDWFETPGLQWALCPFTEAGFLRNVTAPRPGQISMEHATELLAELANQSGYNFLPITLGWETLSAPFAKRLYGTKQVTDAYLLGLAIHAGLILVTMDKGILHLAGSEHRRHVLLLEAKR